MELSAMLLLSFAGGFAGAFCAVRFAGKAIEKASVAAEDRTKKRAPVYHTPQRAAAYLNGKDSIPESVKIIRP